MADKIKENLETVQRAELHRKIWAIADDVRGARSDRRSLWRM